jgi:hypothetical protein
MQNIIQIKKNKVIPPITDVLSSQGIPEGKKPDQKIFNLARESISLYRQCSEPCGIIKEISMAQFASVYYGDGRNEVDTPLEEVFPKAERLALFAVTIGEKISLEISHLFDRNEFALGSMLDTTASEGTELAAVEIESYYEKLLKKNRLFDRSKGMLRFSPGYCGWHMSGQRKLFEFLEPESIEITLSSSFLMQPLKSISGVIVFGDREIFAFDDNYPFCAECADHACRDRLKAILGDHHGK